MSSKDKKHILKLIQKLQDGIASNQEIEHLSNFFISHQDSKEWPINVELKESIKKKIFQEVQQKIKGTPKKAIKVLPLYKRPIFKYTVAASLVMLISIVAFLNKDSSETIAPIIVKTEIEIGSDKATLTLEDGSDVTLEKGQNYSSNNLSSNGEKLVYKKEDRSKQEIVYNFLTIPRGGKFFLELSDATKVWLNSDTKLKYPVNFIEGEQREVELVYGEAYFDVSPSANHNGTKFIVKNKSQEVEVLGTEFNIKAYQDDAHIYTTLVEGKVSINSNNTNVILNPSEQSIIGSLDSNIKVVTVDIYNETSWKDGVFSFESKSLKEIMKVMSRWYDMDVIFADKNLEDIKFIGVLSKDQNIKEILSTIENLGFIKSYEINNKYIILN